MTLVSSQRRLRHNGASVIQQLQDESKYPHLLELLDVPTQINTSSKGSIHERKVKTSWILLKEHPVCLRPVYSEPQLSVICFFAFLTHHIFPENPMLETSLNLVEKSHLGKVLPEAKSPSNVLPRRPFFIFSTDIR